MSGKLLIVEDEPVVALDLRQELEEYGCEVTGLAESADAALISIEEDRPDMVLMDIRIDGSMDGVQAARLIRHLYQVPVIFITSYADKDTLRRAAQELPYGYLTKPFRSKELQATLSVALHKAAVDAEIRATSRFMSMAIEGSHEAMVLVSDDGLIQFMNQAAEEMAGLTLLRARGMLLGEVFDLVDIYQRPVPMPVKEGESASVEEFGWYLRRPDRGQMIVDFTVRSLVADDGEHGGHVLTLRDATERMRKSVIEASTKDNEYFDYAPMPMVQLDGEGRIMRINRKLLDDSGLPMERLIGRSLTALLADPDPRITKQFVYKLLRPFRDQINALPPPGKHLQAPPHFLGHGVA